MNQITKVIYIVLFLALLLHPHLITGHFFSIPLAYAQSIITLVILSLAYMTYILHHKDIRRREIEKKALNKELQISDKKLVDVFKYVGTVNHRLPLLKQITTGLMKRSSVNLKDKKKILYDLLNIAVNSARSNWGMFRFVETSSQRTVKDIIYTSGQYVLLKTNVSNKHLVAVRHEESPSGRIDDVHAVSCSDSESDICCFLVFPEGKNHLNEVLPLLKNITDQAQLFYKYLYL